MEPRGPKDDPLFCPEIDCCGYTNGDKAGVTVGRNGISGGAVFPSVFFLLFAAEALRLPSRSADATTL